MASTLTETTIDNPNKPTVGQRLGVEFLGTFWLVLGGCGSAVFAAGFPKVVGGLRCNSCGCSG